MKIDVKVAAPALPNQIYVDVLGKSIPVDLEDLTDEMVAATTQAFGDALAKEVARCRNAPVVEGNTFSGAGSLGGGGGAGAPPPRRATTSG